MADFKWGYAINQWDPVRREQQERAFKTISACGFRAIELTAGTGRWAPIGRPELMTLNFGSTHDFADFHKRCGIDQVASWFYDPGVPYIEEGQVPKSPSNPAQHAAILESIRPYAQTLKELNGSRLVVRPMASWWREAPVTSDKIKAAADCWNAVGRMTQEYGIETTLHVDFLSAIHSLDDLDALMSFTDPAVVGLTIDTAELTVAGFDVVAVYEKYHSRVSHFHFKDTHDRDTLAEYKEPAAEVKLLAAGGQRAIPRWFWEMGTPEGLVDFPGLVRAMKSHGYSGWVIVESDRGPSAPESALLNSWYVQKVLAKI